MKIQNITDVEKFFKVIDQCKGTVELVSPEGDRINLKSKLAQYLSMATIFSNGYILRNWIWLHMIKRILNA